MSRPVCARCERPLNTCLCGWVRATANRVPVLLLQHPLEVHEAKGSARLLRLSLARVQVEVGEVFEPAALQAWLGAPGEAVLLYPATPGLAPATPPAGRSAPRKLVVIDATWRKSLRMLAHNPLLQALPRLALPADMAAAPSAYASLRRAPRSGQLSTLEATCCALQALEADADAHSADAAALRYAPLLQAFGGHVAEHVARVPRP